MRKKSIIGSAGAFLVVVGALLTLQSTAGGERDAQESPVSFIGLTGGGHALRSYDLTSEYLSRNADAIFSGTVVRISDELKLSPTTQHGHYMSGHRVWFERTENVPSASAELVEIVVAVEEYPLIVGNEYAVAVRSGTFFNQGVVMHPLWIGSNQDGRWVDSEHELSLDEPSLRSLSSTVDALNESR